ncbi:MAG: type VI secretion system baseplate subunit TssK [Planctomycetota bacterium]
MSGHYAQKVLWGEGMLLTPQHFQQHDRYLEHLVQQRIKSIQALDWGFTRLDFDKDALQNGQLVVTDAAGVMPDGTAFDMPGVDKLPEPRPIAPHFGAGEKSLGVVLGIPRRRAGEVSTRLDDSTDALTTFQGHRARVRDEVGAEEREIVLCQKRLQVLFTSEDREAYTAMPVGVLTRTAAGGFEFDSFFVPPCLYAGASPRILAVVRRLLDVLAKRSMDLSGKRRGNSAGMVDFTLSEAANFWFLHTINGHLPALRSLFSHPRVHPREVYLELSTLAGELCTFSTESTPQDVPPYNPDDLTTTFFQLEQVLLKLLGTVLPTKCVPIPVQKQRDMLYVGQITDERLFGTARFYLGVRAETQPEKLKGEVPIKAKVSSTDRVDGLIVRALPGVGLQLCDKPPREIPVQAGSIYFELTQQGPEWDAIKASRNLAVYIPAEFPQPRLELMAVKA